MTHTDTHGGRRARLKRALCLFVLAALLGASLPVSAESAAGLVPFVFYSDVNPADHYLTGEVYYDDSLFAAPATQYSRALAQASMGIAFSNFREAGKAPEDQAYATRDFLTAAGFTEVQADQYDVDTTSDTVASMIASKRTVIGGEPCTVIAVSICGAGYANEWLSNFMFSEEDRHEGFDRAADKVLSRLLLYLFNHPTEDRVKVWISGYSRAAAIANLLGQKLSNGKLCSVEDLFVYTFATPNTGIAESEWSCPSIFNIVGSFDPVPAIPPAEWSYSRYGTTLYLPAQEVDSDYARLRAAVEPIYRDLTGIEYWNNPTCNWFLQKLMQILYSSVGSAETYSSFLQNIISGMWATSGILPRIRLLSDVMKADTGTDSSVRSLFAAFKEVLSPFLFNLLTASGKNESRYWGEGVSAFTQIMHEHNTAVYYAWMMSSDDPEDLFLSKPAFSRVSLPTELRIDGIALTENGAERPAQDISGISFDKNTILNIPGDRAYTVTLTAERDISAEQIAINGYTLPSLETNVTLITMDLAAGETAELVLPADGAPEMRKADASVVRARADVTDERDAARIEYNQSGWLAKNLVDLILWIPIVLLGVLAFLIIRLNIRRKEKIFYVRRAFITLMVIFFFLDQVLRNYFPWGVPAIIVCQGICSVSGAFIALFARIRKKDRYSILVLIAMLFWTVGDVITRSSSFVGLVCYGAGHILLCIAFCLERHPDRRHLAVLLVSCALVFPVEIATEHGIGTLLPSMLYTVTILSMATLAPLRGNGTMAGGLLFVVSDLLLTLKTALNAPGWLFFLTLGTYYAAVALISSSALEERAETEARR